MEGHKLRDDELEDNIQTADDDACAVASGLVLIARAIAKLAERVDNLAEAVASLKSEDRA